MVIIPNAKGMANMRHIHPDFKTKKILGYVADLIIEYNYNNYEELHDQDKYALAAMLLEAAGRDGELEFLTEHSYPEILIDKFRIALLSDKKEDNETFIFYAKEQAVEYYEHTMKSLFDYVHNDYQQERKEWIDFAAKHGDPDQAYDLYKENLI